MVISSSSPRLRNGGGSVVCLHGMVSLVAFVGLLLILTVSAASVDRQDDGHKSPGHSSVDELSSLVATASYPENYERGAPVAITPGSIPTPLPLVMSAYPGNYDTLGATTPSPSLLTFTNSLGCLETVSVATADSTPSVGSSAEGAGAGASSAEETWIRIAGILVPAIVAIGLGVGGFLVTLHVNRRSPDDEDDWRS